MKPNDSLISEAKKALQDSSRKLSTAEKEHLIFVATGRKITNSPAEPFESNRSFFHLSNIPCVLNKTISGVFTHEDYSPFYKLVASDLIVYFSCPWLFRGTIEYENWTPKVLNLRTSEIPCSISVAIANPSLTSACI